METPTLLIGYYYGLLLKSIDADLLINKMCSVGLLTAYQKTVVSGGHSVYQKNRLLLHHAIQMNVPALTRFCELIQEIWPLTGSQMIAGN